jgi:ABC-2 type transport system permease protein
MKRVLAVAARLIRQITGDKRTIALLLVAPILMIYLLNVILTSATTTPNIGVISAEETFSQALKEEANVVEMTDEESARDALEDGTIDAYLLQQEDELDITVDGADPNVTKLVLHAVSASIASLAEETLLSIRQYGLQSSDTVSSYNVEYLYGSDDLDEFDSLAPMMMGYFIFFFVFLIAGISFLRERISGTLDRLLASPIRRSEIVLGYFFGFGLFVTVQTVVIEIFIIYVLGVAMVGNFWTVLAINLVLAGGSLALGTLLSSFAANEFQLFQFIPLVIIPQILFSGIFDLRDAPQWVTVLSKIFPMTYGAEALRNIMIRGYGFGDVGKDFAVLFGYMALFLILNIFVLKKYRKA